MTPEEDILIDIPDEDLPKLAEMYKNHKDWAPHIYSTLVTGIEWNKKKNNKLIFMSPNSCWREDGTFFVLLKHYCFDILFFSLDDSGKNIYEAIRKTKRLDFSDYKDRDPLLFAVHNKFYPIADRAIKDIGMTFTFEIPAYMFSIPKVEALKFDITCPQDVCIKKLDTTHAALIDSLWPIHYKNSDKFIAFLIEMNDGYGVFLKSTGELVSWVLISMMGQLTTLQTVQEQKKKGYASLITKYVARELAKSGHNAWATVMLNNIACIKMFEKSGFKSIGRASYCFYAKNKRKNI